MTFYEISKFLYTEASHKRVGELFDMFNPGYPSNQLLPIPLADIVTCFLLTHLSDIEINNLVNEIRLQQL